MDKLIEKYFNGTATPEERAILLRAARNNMTQEDEATANALRSILAIESWGDVSLKHLEEKTPADLEKRLDAHISRLARKGSVLRRRWLIGISAAASLILLFSVGIRLLSPVNGYKNENSGNIAEVNVNNSSLVASPEVNPEKSIGLGNNIDNDREGILSPGKTSEFSSVKASESNSNTSSFDSPMASQGTNKTAVVKVKKTENPGRPKHIKTVGAPAYRIPHLSVEPTINAAVASIDIPEHISPLEPIKPTFASASVNPSQLVVQPFTTLSQAFDNVFETISAINVAFSGAGDTYKTASHELGKITSTPLRSI